MKYLLPISGIALVAVTMTGCSFSSLRSPFSGGTQSSSSLSSAADVSLLTEVSYDGTMLPADAVSSGEGTHRLSLGGGQFLGLQSDLIDLDAFVGQQVKVTGTVRSLIDGEGRIMRVTQVTDVLPEDSSSSDESLMVGVTIDDDVSDLSATVPTEGASSSSSSLVQASSQSSVPPPPPVPSPSSRSSVASSVAVPAVSDGAVDARAATMAKSPMAAENWTQQYCTSHIGFCVPVHRNWWFHSFGASAATLWHVEVSSEDIAALGDGPLAVDFVSGSLPAGVADGDVVEKDGKAVGYRSWTGQRHFEISAPLSLKAAVTYMTASLVTSETTGQ